MNCACITSILSVLVPLLMLPWLAPSLTPNQYDGGRSRDDRARLIRNSSAMGTILGEIRTSMSDVMYIKTERYLDSGVAYVPHIGEELLSVNKMSKQIDAQQIELAASATSDPSASPGDSGDVNYEGVPTIIPGSVGDYRGFIGDLQRKVSPWKAPEDGHEHTDGTELLPWFKVMTLSDPHYTRAYSVGGWWLKRKNFDAALSFVEEGIANNPDAFQIHFMHGQLLNEKAIRLGGEDVFAHPTDEAKVAFHDANAAYTKAVTFALEQRPVDGTNGWAAAEWSDYKEEDAWAAARMMVLTEYRFGDKKLAVEKAKICISQMGPDKVLDRLVAKYVE